MKKKLILFDVDGILIKSVKIGTIARLIEKHFGLDSSNSKVSGEAKTYRRIFVERLRELGIDNPESHENFAKAMKDASPIIEQTKKGFRFEKIENIEGLIRELLLQGHVIGLLTGNTYETAKAKLEPIELWKYFKFGAFGSETLIRGELVDIAIKEAEKETGIKFNREDAFVIGDTPLDIECARFGKVKSIAVATGKTSLENLEDEKPDYAFRDFRDIDKILKVINS